MKVQHRKELEFMKRYKGEIQEMKNSTEIIVYGSDQCENRHQN